MNKPDQPRNHEEQTANEDPGCSNRLKKRVLLVEDEPLSRALIIQKLEKAGFDVEVAPNGSLALKKLANGHLDAIFIDLMIPDFLGVEVIKEARRDRQSARRPIYVCTNSWPTNLWSQKAAKAGATKVFDKLLTSVDEIVAEVAADLIKSPHAGIQPQTNQPNLTEQTEAKEILSKIKEKVDWLRDQLSQIGQCRNPETRAAKCGKLLPSVISVGSCAAAAGMARLTREATCIEGFLKELGEKPKRFTPSSGLTIATAVEALDRVTVIPAEFREAPLFEMTAVLVDSNFFARRATSKILGQVGFKLNPFADSTQALEFLKQHRVDLVVAELLSSNENRIELNKKVRALSTNDRTPVILLGPPQIAESVSPASFSEGEFVVKPFLPSELVLKALSVIMINRTPHQASSPPSPPNSFVTPTPSASHTQDAPGPSAESYVPVPSTPGTEPSLNETTPTNTAEEIPVLSSSEVGVILIDQNRKIITANGVSAAMFGWPKLPGKDVGILLKGELDNEFGRVFLQNHPPGNGSQRFFLRVTGLCKGGPEFPASVILTRSSVNSKTCWTAVFQKLNSGEDGESHTSILRNASDELEIQCQAMAVEAASSREALEKAQKEHDEIAQQLQEALSSKQDLEKQLSEQSISQESLAASFSDFREQLDASRSAFERKEADYQQEVAQNERLKEEVIGLRQLSDELTEKLTIEQKTSVNLTRRRDDLERELRENADTLQAQAAALNREEMDWRGQIDASQKKAEQAEAAQQEEANRVRQLEEQLTRLRQAHEEIENKLADQQRIVDETKLSHEEIDLRFREQAAELQQARAALENQAESNSNLPRLDSHQEEPRVELQRLREIEATFEAERSESEQRVREGVSSIARLTADLEKERKERRRIEQRAASLTTQLQEMHEDLRQHLESERVVQERLRDFEQQLHDREELMTRLQTDLRKEVADRELAEEQLRAAGDMNSQLQNFRALFEESKQSFKRSQEDLERRLDASMKALQESESKALKESGERKRLEESLVAVQRDLQEHSERAALEQAKLISRLQVEQLERKQLEGNAAQSRYASLDSARVSRALANSLRRQVRQPVESLLHSTRVLLDAELAEEQKQVVELMLENALLLQTCLQEGTVSTNGTAPASTEADLPESHQDDSSQDADQAA
jgi:CheY-like chemotaxis protein